MSLQYAVSRRSVGSHCTPGGVTPPLKINDWGVIQPGESLIPLTLVNKTNYLNVYRPCTSFAVPKTESSNIYRPAISFYLLKTHSPNLNKPSTRFSVLKADSPKLTDRQNGLSESVPGLLQALRYSKPTL